MFHYLGGFLPNCFLNWVLVGACLDFIVVQVELGFCGCLFGFYSSSSSDEILDL